MRQFSRRPIDGATAYHHHSCISLGEASIRRKTRSSIPYPARCSILSLCGASPWSTRREVPGRPSTTEWMAYRRKGEPAGNGQPPTPYDENPNHIVYRKVSGSDLCALLCVLGINTLEEGRNGFSQTKRSGFVTENCGLLLGNALKMCGGYL